MKNVLDQNQKSKVLKWFWIAFGILLALQTCGDKKLPDSVQSAVDRYTTEVTDIINDQVGVCLKDWKLITNYAFSNGKIGYIIEEMQKVDADSANVFMFGENQISWVIPVKTKK